MSVPTHERIGTVLTDWLRAEISDSDTGRNAILSDFNTRKSDLSLPFDDLSNLRVQKVRSHYQRLRLFAQQYAEDGSVHDDQTTARLIFCSLMMVSGDYRTQCLIESQSAEQYNDMRHNRSPAGVDIYAIARDELADPTLLHADPTTRIETLISRTLQVNDANFEAYQYIYSAPDERAVADDRFDGLSPSEAVRISQHAWTGLAVAQISVAASFRDNDYARVPFFEPRSITDQVALQYPLA